MIEVDRRLQHMPDDKELKRFEQSIEQSQFTDVPEENMKTINKSRVKNGKKELTREEFLRRMNNH